MSKKTLKLVLAGAFVAGALGAVGLRSAWATAPQGVITNTVQGPFGLDEIFALNNAPPDYTAVVKTRGLSDTYFQYLKIAPGGNTGWHSHPGISFVMVQSGTLTIYQDDFTSAVYPAGTGFVEEAGDVHIAVNEGDTNLELAVFYLLPKGAPRRIDEPAPQP